MKLRLLITAALSCLASLGMAQNYLCFTAEKAGSRIAITSYNNNAPDLKYSTDREEWKTLEEGEYIILENEGDKVYMRGYNPMGFSRDKLHSTHFSMSGLIAASGSVMSLLDNMGESEEIYADHCFFQLFRECTSLTKAPELPATTLSENCYEMMFYGCKKLKKAPKLPAKNLERHCYVSMFNACTALEEGADINAMKIPPFSCIGMYRNCVSLKKAPALPAKELGRECYRDMFRDCSSLTEAPELPATNVIYDCYRCMFTNCTSLKKAPDLMAKELDYKCYFEMFKGCEKLNSIKVGFTNWGYDTFGWLDDCAEKGTIECPKNLPEEFGFDKIPNGWKVVKK